MKQTIWSWAGMLAILLLAAGCRTTPHPPRPAGKAPAAPAGESVTPAAPPREAPSFEQRAEAEARFMTGLCHEMRGEPEQALDQFHQAVMADPGNERLVLDLTTRFILAQRYDTALTLIQKALDQPGASSLLDLRLAFVQLHRGKTNEAVRANQNAIRKAPRSIAGYDNLFHLLRATGQTNEAEKVVAQATAVSKPDAEFLVGLAEFYFFQNRAYKGTNETLKAKALDALQRAAKQTPTDFFVLQKLSDGFAQLGDRKQAAAVLLRIQELYPDLPTIRERLVDLYLRERDKKAAAEQLEGLVRDNPTNPQAYYLLGILAFDEEEFAEAADCFHKTILLKPDFEPAYYELAVSKLNLNQPKEALEILGKARQKFNESFLGEYFGALAYMRQKDYTNAVQRFNAAEVIASATETNRLTHIFYFQLGSACERAGRWSEGEKYLQKCLALSPDSPEALNYLGYMYAEKATNLVQAREMIVKALKREPDNAAYIDSLGWVFHQMGEHREALKQIQRAVDLSKEPDATLFDHLGDIHAALKEPAKAREAWRKAISLEPNPAIQKKLDALGP